MGKEKKSRKRLTKVELAEKIRGFFQTQPDIKTNHASTKNACYRCDGRNGVGRFSC